MGTVEAVEGGTAVHHDGLRLIAESCDFNAGPLSRDPPGGDADEDENRDAHDDESDHPLARPADRKPFFHVGISLRCTFTIVAQIRRRCSVSAGA
jgi:hypothetical protein